MPPSDEQPGVDPAIADSAATLNPVVAAAQQQLRPLFDAVIAQLDEDACITEMVFFTTNLLALMRASEPVDIGELFLQLSTTAFMGFQFSPEQAQLVDNLLAQAEQLAHVLSADSSQPH